MKEKLSGPFALHAASGKDLGQTGVVSKQGDRGAVKHQTEPSSVAGQGSQGRVRE